MIKAVNTLVPQEVPPASGELTPVDGVDDRARRRCPPGRAGEEDYGGNRAADGKVTRIAAKIRNNRVMIKRAWTASCIAVMAASSIQAAVRG